MCAHAFENFSFLNFFQIILLVNEISVGDISLLFVGYINETLVEKKKNYNCLGSLKLFVNLTF